MILPRPNPMHGKVRVVTGNQAGAEASKRADAMEAFLDAIWRAEADWRLMDRIDLATRSNLGVK